VDLLLEFEPSKRPGLLGLAAIEEALSVLLDGGSFVIPSQREQGNEKTDFELVTWRVVLAGVNA
jgi:hypothetical protein